MTDKTLKNHPNKLASHSLTNDEMAILEQIESQLREESQRLSKEINEHRKSLSALLQPVRVRRRIKRLKLDHLVIDAIIAGSDRKLNVVKVCKALQVNRSTYYHQKDEVVQARSHARHLAMQAKEAELIEAIKKIFLASNNLFGPRRIKPELLKTTRFTRVSHRKIGDIMAKNNLVPIRIYNPPKAKV